jgi:hypothetical protein
MLNSESGLHDCPSAQPPTRDYTFDTDFQNINKLPPGAPRFTDVNALSYYQSVLPSQWPTGCGRRRWVSFSRNC